MLSCCKGPHELRKCSSGGCTFWYNSKFIDTNTLVQKEGFSRILEIDDSMNLLLLSMDYINMVSQSSVLMVLAAVCVVSRSAQTRIVDDIRGNNRFATIVNFMRTKDEDLKVRSNSGSNDSFSDLCIDWCFDFYQFLTARCRGLEFSM